MIDVGGRQATKGGDFRKRILVARPESDLAELANVTKIMTYVNPERTTAHDRSDTPQ